MLNSMGDAISGTDIAAEGPNPKKQRQYRFRQVVFGSEQLGDLPTQPNNRPTPPLSPQPCFGTPQPYVSPYQQDGAVALLQNEVDATDLLHMLCYLGVNNIASATLSRGSKACTAFDDSGRICDQYSLGLSPVFTNEERLRPALDRLISLQRVMPASEPESYAIPPPIYALIKKSTAASAASLQVEALNLLCHTFPKHPDAEPLSYVIAGRSQLPLARYFVNFLDSDTYCLTKDLSIDERHRIVNFCLSFSNFSTPEWKRKAIQLGERINVGLGDKLLLARLSVRKKRLSRLCPSHGFEEQLPTKIDDIPITTLTNSIRGDQILLEAQELIDRDRLSLAWSKLNEWKPVEPVAEPLQAGIQFQVMFLQVKICRFAGHFRLARKYSYRLLNHTSTWNAPHVFSTLIAVLCELGDTSAAKNLLQAERDNVRYEAQAFPTRKRRLDLADAQIRLMEGLWSTKCSAHAEARHSLQLAKAIFNNLLDFYQQDTSPTLATSVNHFSILASLAIIEHLQCETDTSKIQLAASLSCWESCWDFAQKCLDTFHWEPSFTQTIILYSQSHIMVKQGRREDAKKKAKEAFDLHLVTGCQTFWLALGTLWFDIVGVWIDRDNGVNKLCRYQVKVPLEEVCEEEFPFAVDSQRTV